MVQVHSLEFVVVRVDPRLYAEILQVVIVNELVLDLALLHQQPIVVIDHIVTVHLSADVGSGRLIKSLGLFISHRDILKCLLSVPWHFKDRLIGLINRVILIILLVIERTLRDKHALVCFRYLSSVMLGRVQLLVEV